ncbi:unnamed protein product [Caenorhabditis sp. 36 PRJEB53466]|nr:unnamed protein product [Caenorhabditis sp. 36 PRJEB53466]
MTTPESPVCASEEHLEMYRSHAYTAALFFNLAIAITSIVLIMLATKKLMSEGIINTSTRIFLIVGLMCCTLHQTAYIFLRASQRLLIFFRLSEPCRLYYKAYDCRLVTFGLVAGNCGMILIQSAMTVDRILATVFANLWPRLKYWPGVVLSVMVIVSNYLVNEYVFWNDPLTDYRFMRFLTVAFYLSIGHMFVNVVILYRNVVQDRRQRNSFNVNERYQSRETLKSTQAIFFLSMSQFFAMFLYTVLTDFFLKLQPTITPLQYGLALALIYTTPYTCIVIPTLIMLTLCFIRHQRMRSINAMRSQTETGDEHMRKIQEIWAK